MYSKIKISGYIKVVTGLHIGCGGTFSAIGAVDSPVVRDPKTKMPIIPGSSLKGKMRSLLSRDKYGIVDLKNEKMDIVRLFGSSTVKDENDNIVKARLQILDSFYNDVIKSDFKKNDIPYTEVKYENSIDRIKGISDPRQIERVIRDSKFDLEIIYNVEKEEEISTDFQNIELAFKLIENDYLGGGGTRGNGRVKFEELKAIYVTGEHKGDVAYEFKNI